jgi:hypothetical protein
MRVVSTGGRPVKPDTFATLRAMLIGALCLPFALLIGSGATVNFLDAMALPLVSEQNQALKEDQKWQNFPLLAVIHAVAITMLIFAFATAVHEARRVRDGTGELVSPTAQFRNRKSSVWSLPNREIGQSPPEVRDLSRALPTAYTSRCSPVPTLASPIVDEMVRLSPLPRLQ